MALLEAKKVTKRFGGLVAVNEYDFEIDTGEIISIIGPNGAGKTTFFNCVTGFYAHEEGEIHFEGRLLNGRTPDQVTRFGIARTYQNIRIFPAMTAIEKAAFALCLDENTPEEITEVSKQLLHGDGRDRLRPGRVYSFRPLHHRLVCNNQSSCLTPDRRVFIIRDSARRDNLSCFEHGNTNTCVLSHYRSHCVSGDDGGRN